jgi:LacI family transcriptional regulator
MREQKVTMRQVAAEAGVTVGTISAVLRGARDRNFYSDETRDRVLAVVARLGYRVNPSARSLREGRTRVVGVLLDDLTLPFLASLIRATGRALEAHGYSIMLCHLDAARAPREALLRLFARGHIDAFMLAGALDHLTDRDLLDIHARGHQMVLLERATPTPEIPSVGVDNHQGGALAVTHLVTRGCQRLVVLGGPTGNPMAQQRVAGAQAAWTQQGRPAEDLTIVSAGGWTAELGYEAMNRHLASGVRPDGLFACNDLLALGAIRALNETGCSVPENTAVVGFDDYPLAAYAQPPLTTIRQPAERMGQAAAELLVARPKAEPHSPNLLLPELILRKSA